MGKILVVCGHPDYRRSFANRHILDEFHRIVPHAEIIYLDALYKDFIIDVKREQRRLKDPDTLVFEFPFWWYGAPSLTHRYMEAVFTHGFAYGTQGKALEGKKFILSFTTGASEDAYTPEGYQHVTIEQLMPPFLAMVNLTGMDWRGKIVSYGMALIDPANMKQRDEIITKAKHHAIRLAALAEGEV